MRVKGSSCRSEDSNRQINNDREAKSQQGEADKSKPRPKQMKTKMIGYAGADAKQHGVFAARFYEMRFAVQDMCQLLMTAENRLFCVARER